ncbi:hypothetical protein CP970_37530 [Streptomyces kanamyceticus]|uniref:Integral membrane protein n=2 Tax=Streptomyces kanamyceticus TaxID=1967 RepID=A0A5J6GTW6_STRKN|nr:hypothetical protein [Streptomyces kanamyceticus]QEU97804.1 hypothetical protein CP970_37530 [Streptomyces kanamyceticus]
MRGRWYTALGLNVVLGVPAVIPIWMLYYIAATWKDPEPTENDGLAVVVVGFGSVAAACGFLWWAANRSLARRTRLSQPQYWLLSGLGTLLPTAVLICLAA